MEDSSAKQHSNDTVIDMLREQTRNTAKALDEHVSFCGKLQKWQIIIGCVIVLLVEGHSPEASALVDKIIQAILR